LLTEEEKLDIDQLMQAAVQAKLTEDHVFIEKTTEDLAKGTEAFAALRMNESIRKVLSGKTIGSI
jgi:molecular chaperone HscA